MTFCDTQCLHGFGLYRPSILLTIYIIHDIWEKVHSFLNFSKFFEKFDKFTKIWYNKYIRVYLRNVFSERYRITEVIYTEQRF